VQHRRALVRADRRQHLEQLPSEARDEPVIARRLCERFQLEYGGTLVLAGKVENTPASREYYAAEVLPWIDGDRVVHLSNVAGREKATLLGGATALLAPILWDEPFGLSVVEAMAIGTPAISFARGAARELIDDGLTGFLVSDADEMVAAVGRVTEAATGAGLAAIAALGVVVGLAAVVLAVARVDLIGVVRNHTAALLVGAALLVLALALIAGFVASLSRREPE